MPERPDADTPTEKPATPGWSTVAPPGDSLPVPALAPADRYNLLDEVGRGGMGVVYRATDTALGREVALKVLSERFAHSPAVAHRFAGEARIAGQLQHPAIPPVHDIGTLADGRPFLAMKLIKGDTLDRLLAECPDPSHDRGRFVAVFEQVCQAVAYAHSKGVIHRDLKPGNVMVGAFGEVQVMDWGLAKVLADRPTVASDPHATVGTEIRPLPESGRPETQVGSALGTPAFMPPEQAAGAIDEVDQRSDVFGLGAILCTILTGGPPFEADGAEPARLLAARGKLEGAFARLDGCGADPDLVGLCKRCLAPDRDDRPAEAGAVARAVAGLRAAADERARQAELDRVRAEARAAAERRRRRAQLAAAVSLAVLVALAGFGGWYLQRQADERARQDQRVRDGVAAALDRLPELYQRALWRQAGQAIEQAEGLLGPGGDPELRERVLAARRDTAFLQRLDEIRQVRLTPVEGPDDSRAAPSRYQAAFADNGFDILAGDLADLAERLRASPVQSYLLAALDDWGMRDHRLSRRRRIFAVTAAATGQDWRTKLPEAWADRARLAEVYDAIPAEQLSPGLIYAVGLHLAWEGSGRLQAGLRRYPADFWLLFALGSRALGKDRAEARAGALRAALALRPGTAAVHIELGHALWDGGNVEGALHEFREAIGLEPNNHAWRFGLGRLLSAEGDPNGAIQAFREALRLQPNYFPAQAEIARVLRSQGDRQGAAREFREAIRLAPTNGTLRLELGRLLEDQGDLNGAIRVYREARRLEPKASTWPRALGLLLYELGDLDGAIEAFRECIRLSSTGAVGERTYLGRALSNAGDLEGAVRELREAVRLAPTDANCHAYLGLALLYGSGPEAAIPAFREALHHDRKNRLAQQRLKLAERYLELAPVFQSVKRGARVGHPKEALELAGLAVLPFNREYALGLRLYSEAFRADPELIALHNYNAACCAALVAAGDDAGMAVGVEEWHHLQAQARKWLGVSLAGIRTHAASDEPANRRRTLATLAHWRRDSDLASVRDPKWLAAMPADERAAWEQFWAEADALRQQLAPPPAKP